MSQYSVLNLNEIIEICNQYGILDVKSFSILSGGSENTNYLVTTESVKFVLTICEQKTMQSARELASLLEHLAENKFETSKLVRTTENKKLSEFSNKPVMLKNFLEGEILKDLPNHILEVIGAQMGRLHKIEPPTYLPDVLNYGKEFFNEVSYYAPDSSFELWIKEIEDYIQPYFSKNLPKSLIHSDIFYSNVIVSKDKNKACIMDFEEATNYYRIFDVGMTLVGLCCNGEALNADKAKALLKGYQQEIELHEVEKRSLQAFTVYAATAMTFWRHRNFNHIIPNAEMYDHYLGLKVVADFVKAIPPTDFVKILR